MAASPASYVDSIVETLQTELATHSVLPTAIRAHDWDYSGEQLLTIGDPFVLIMPKSIQITEDTGALPQGVITMAAYCGARQAKSKDVDLGVLDSRGDVAGFIASTIAVLAKTQTWGSEYVTGYGDQIQAVNAHSAKLKEQGLGLWITVWSQTVILGSDMGTILGPISGFHGTHTSTESTVDTVPYETQVDFDI